MKKIILEGEEKHVNGLLKMMRLHIKKKGLKVTEFTGESPSDNTELNNQIKTLKSEKEELSDVNNILKKEVETLRKQPKKKGIFN